MKYRYAIDCEVAEDILQLSGRYRDEFVKIFRQLADDPFQLGEQNFNDATGRKIQKKQLGRWLVSYWTDHPVKEVRIVGIQRIKA